jgi:hypothetical protein
MTKITRGPLSSVADPGYLSRTRTLFLSIPDPRSKISNRREGRKKCFDLFFCSHKYHKIENCFVVELAKKKIWDNLQKIEEPFSQKIVIKLSKL